MNIEDIAFTNKHELEQVEKYGYIVVGDSAVRAKEMQWLLSERDRLDAENAELRRLGIESNDLIMRLGNENAELRNVLAKYAHAVGEGHPIPCDLGPLCPYCYIDHVDADLTAANATLDALRDLCGPNKTISNRTCMKMVDILYPQPQETGDDKQ